MSKFIPAVIICGNKNELTDDLGVEFEILGEFKIIDNRIFFGSVECSRQDFFKIPFDYILCSNYQQFFHHKDFFYNELQIPFGVVVTRNFFREFVSNVGYAPFANVQLLTEKIQQLEDVKLILDADNFFARADVFDYPNYLSENPTPRQFSIDTVAENFDSMFENIYSEWFSSLDEIKLRHYDLTIFTAERTIDEWLGILNWAVDFSQNILIYIQHKSLAYQDLKSLSIEHAKIDHYPAIRGEWLEIKLDQPSTFQNFVITHKKYFMPDLPKNYTKIHAGRKLSSIDLGILGDDSGDNISELNPFLNEMTAIYWVWKNYRADYIGFSHYHRFFLIDHHILTATEAIDLLKDCDIITGNAVISYGSWVSGFDEFDSDHGIDEAHRIFLKHLRQISPEYVRIYERFESGIGLYANQMFITRWQVFDSYCDWIFKIILPAMKDFPAEKYKTSLERRQIAYIAERLLNVFIFNNHLRIKNIPVFRGPEESTEENFSLEHFSQLFTSI